MTTATSRRIARSCPPGSRCWPRSAAGPGRPPTTQEAKDGKGKWVPLFQRHANDYVITAGAGAEAKMLPDPLLRWWQPIRGGDDGALYLWVEEGRPVAAVTFFTFKWPDGGERVIVHERHSFAPGPLEATWRGEIALAADRPRADLQADARRPRARRDRPGPAPPDAGPGPRRLGHDHRREGLDLDDAAPQQAPLSLRGRRPGRRRRGPLRPGPGDRPRGLLLPGSPGHGEGRPLGVRRRPVHRPGRSASSTRAGRSSPARTRSAAGTQIYFCNTVLSKPSDSPEDFR